MRWLSTVPGLLVGCALHVGVPPSGEGWQLPTVTAAVAEPGVDDSVRAAVTDALASRRALGGRPLAVTVEEASWTPSRRSGDVLLYDARLVVRFDAGDRSRRAWAARAVIDPGSAGAAQASRAGVFAELARQVAAEGVAWLLAGG